MSPTSVKPLSPKQAWQMLHDNPSAVLIDVRSTMEFLFVGHPKGAVHVAWIDEPDWHINPEFVTHVRKLMLGGVSCDADDGCVPIILICRSGHRSLEAAQLLIKNGLQHVYNVEGGFEGELDDTHHRNSIGGWRFDGLPWEQC